MRILSIDPTTLETEKQLLGKIRKLAKVYHWRVYHTWSSIHSAAGFPDLVLARDRVIYAELKSEKGKLTEAQQEWLDALKECGQEVYCWRPSDWDAIVEVLRTAL